MAQRNAVPQRQARATKKVSDLKIEAKLRDAKQVAADGKGKNAQLGDGVGLDLSISRAGSGPQWLGSKEDGKAKLEGLNGYPWSREPSNDFICSPSACMARMRCVASAILSLSCATRPARDQLDQVRRSGARCRR
jgi:hypothetical protein